ncbi:MAG: DUF3800 domain-containing protein [Bacteroidales bacterium]|nr:DUF3800 domain-containing protein [Bacteroidales bacterium]
MGWPKGPHFGGKVPATFLMADGIEIFIDESGDFGSFDERCPYYIIAMVFHESMHPLFACIQELEYRLSLLDLENHCIHSSPAIRGEGAYYGMELATRRKMMSYFAAFVRKSGLLYKSFLVQKMPDDAENEIVSSLRETLEPFVIGNAERLSSYSTISVSYDRGQKPLSRLITEMFAERFSHVRIMKTLPIYSRIFQVADFVCTMRRLAFKLQYDGRLAKSETRFFGSVGNFRKIWLKPLLKSEWK